MDCGVVALMGCHAGCGHGRHALVCGSYVGVAAGGPGAEDEDAHCGFGCVLVLPLELFLFLSCGCGCGDSGGGGCGGDGGTDEQTQLKYTVIAGEERSCVVYTKARKK